jgi:archaellum biogenesis protein FlaJ (TadC family)
MTLDEKDYCLYGSFILSLSLGSIFLSLLALIFSLFDIKFSITLLWIAVIIISILSIFFINKKKYKQLDKKYKNERHSKLKGWLVLLYVIGSVAMYFVSLYVFDV